MDAEKADDLIRRIADFLAIDNATLATNFKNTGAQLRIPELEGQANNFKEVIRPITRTGLELLPNIRFNELIGFANQILGSFDRVHTHLKRTDERDDDQIRNLGHYFRLNENDQNSFAYQLRRLWDIVVESVALTNSQVFSRDQAEQVAKLMRDAEKKSQTLDSLLEAAKTEMSVKGVVEHAIAFEQQAGKHRKSSVQWGRAAMMLAALDFLLLVVMGLGVSSAKDNNQKISLAVLSFLMVSLLSYAVVQAVRNFNNEKHNQLINQHKANCLTTFKTLIASAATPELQSVIMQYTSQTIFSQFNPGYLSKEMMQTPMPLLELLRAAAQETRK